VSAQTSDPLLCCNNVAAIGALKTLHGKDLQAGRDIGLTGLDDRTICRFNRPSLITTQFSPSEISGLAFGALLDQIEDVKNKTDYEYKIALSCTNRPAHHSSDPEKR
jgi:LacI family repressor for deo operon, udp, cdd, tsx, nupC, and nupG